MWTWPSVALIVTGLTVWLLTQWNARNDKGAPRVPGLGPVLGNTLQVALHGTHFLHHSRNRVSRDVFEVNLAGRRMTFLFHPAAIQTFFTAPDDVIAFR